MGRKKKNAGGRRFDTRLDIEDIAKIIRLTPRQKVTMLRYMREKTKGGGHTKT